jgi:hypothetical protein
MSEQHPQHAEVERFLACLMNAGFILDEVDDGADWYPCHNDLPSTRDTILGVDESRLRLRIGEDQDIEILIVLGNGPGELASNYTCAKKLEAVIETWAVAEQRLAEEKADKRFLIVFEDDTSTEFDAPDLATAWEMGPGIAEAHRKTAMMLVRPVDNNDDL